MLDSSYSEMDRNWSFLAVKQYHTESDSTLSVTGHCSPKERENGPAILIGVPSGVRRVYRSGEAVAQIRIRIGEALREEEWFWANGYAFPEDGIQFLRGLGPPGAWIEVPSEDFGNRLFKIEDPRAGEVADWLEARCPGRKP